MSKWENVQPEDYEKYDIPNMNLEESVEKLEKNGQIFFMAQNPFGDYYLIQVLSSEQSEN